MKNTDLQDSAIKPLGLPAVQIGSESSSLPMLAHSEISERPIVIHIAEQGDPWSQSLALRMKCVL